MLWGHVGDMRRTGGGKLGRRNGKEIVLLVCDVKNFYIMNLQDHLELGRRRAEGAEGPETDDDEESGLCGEGQGKKGSLKKTN